MTIDDKFPNNVKDIDYHVAQFLKDKLVHCELCRQDGNKLDISSKELNDAYKKAKKEVLKEDKEQEKGSMKGYDRENYPIFFNDKFEYKTDIIKSKGLYGNGKDAPKWICPKCELKYPLKIKHYKEMIEVLEMVSKLRGIGISKKLIKKYKDITYKEYEEYSQVFSINIKNDSFEAHVDDNKVYWAFNEDELKKVLTEPKIKELENRIINFAKEIRKENDKATGEIEANYNWVLWEWDEGVVSYRNDKLIIQVTDDEDFSECEINEITKSETVLIGDFKLEFAIDNDLSLINAIWKKAERPKDKKGGWKLYENKDYYEPHHIEIREFNIIHQSDKYRSVGKEDITKKVIDIYDKLLNGGEFTLNFSGKEFRFYCSRYFNKEQNKYSFQYRDIYGEDAFSNEIKLEHDGHLRSLLDIHKKILEWIDKYTKKSVIDTKITSVGADSRHIVFDKKEGLPLFFGFDDCSYLPSDIVVRVEYFTDKIVIGKK